MKNAAGGTREFGMDFWCLYVFSGAIQPYGNKRDVQASEFLRSFCSTLYFQTSCLQQNVDYSSTQTLFAITTSSSRRTSPNIHHQ